MGIPTVVLKDNFGQLGTLNDWDIQPLDIESIMKNIEHQFDKGRDVEWIEKTIEGGVEYNSIEKYIEHIRNII